MNKEAFLKAYIQSMINKGNDIIWLTAVLQLIDIAFNDPDAYDKLDADGKSHYNFLEKQL